MKPFKNKILRKAYSMYFLQLKMKQSYLNGHYADAFSEPHKERFLNEIVSLESICRRIQKLIQ